MEGGEGVGKGRDVVAGEKRWKKIMMMGEGWIEGEKRN